MRVLILPSWYPDCNSRLNGIFVKEQVKALHDIGVDVRVFYPFDKSLRDSKLSILDEDGVKTYRCNTDYLKNTKVSRVNSTVQTIRRLKQIKKEYDFDIIHCHVCYFAGIIGYLYRKLTGTKYLVTEHMSYIASYAAKKYDYILLKKTYSSAESVVCVSQYLVNNLKKLGFEFKEVVIGNSVDMSVFSDTRLNTMDTGLVNILFAGSMGNDEVKGLPYLLRAFAGLLKYGDNYRLHIAGDGTKRQEYEKLAEELKLQDYTFFYGNVDRPHLARLMQSCSFFVLPSKYETFGAVIIEALSCGKPVVTTDTGAQKEIINDIRLGYIVKACDVESLLEGLKYMSDNYMNYDSSYLREYASNYSSANIAGKVSELYKTTLGNNGGLK